MCLMFGLFGKKSKALQLIRDSQSIIRSDETAYADRHLLKISAIANSSIQRALNESGGKANGDKTPRWLKEAHRDARRRHNQAALSGVTLAIIFLKAQELGNLAQPACDAIDEFIARWPVEEEPSAQVSEEKTFDG